MAIHLDTGMRTISGLQPKSLSIHGGMLDNYIASRDELLYRANDVFKGLREGWLKLRIDHVFPLEQAVEAQRL